MQQKLVSTIKTRSSRYGSPLQNAELTQSLLKVVEDFCPRDKLSEMHWETLHMIFHKIARMVIGDEMYEDNPHDIAGYATLLENYLKEQNAENYLKEQDAKKK